MKYIRFQGGMMPVFVCFPDYISHSDVAKALAAADKADKMRYGPVVSAGFVAATGACFGESDGLGVKAKESDTDMFKAVMRTTARST